MEKKCRDCQKLKPLSDFYTHSQMRDGHLNKCIECVKRRVGAWRGNNLERVRAYDRLRGRTEERKAGILKKPELCFDCKKKCERLHGHHEDYSKPLDVLKFEAEAEKEIKLLENSIDKET